MKTLVRSLALGLFLMSGMVSAGETLNINTADAVTLAAALDGVGKTGAEAIVAYREEHGPFKSLDDLKNVKGIGDKTIAKNQEIIRFTD